MTSKKHISILVVLVFLFTSLFSSFAFAADEMVLAEGITIIAKAHVQTHGDLEAKSSKGEVQVGTTGEKKRLESFSLELEGAPADMSIAYQAHVQTYGDLDAVVGPKSMGTTGEKKRVEAVAIALVDKDGDLYEGYSVEYRVHQQSYGWSKWVKDGEFAGVKGEKKRIEAIEVRIKTVADLKVEGLSTTSYKEVFVKFNKALDADLAEDTDNYAITGNTVANAALVDSKTVALTLGTAISQQGDIEVTVKKAVGLKEDYKNKVTGVIDAFAPSVLAVEAVGNKQIKVTFSEPVSLGYLLLSSYKLDGNFFAANVPTISDDGKTVTINVTNRLSSGVHKFVVTNAVKDYAGLAVLSNETEFVVVSDATAAAVVKHSATQTKLTVEFNEEIETPALSDVVAAQGTVTGVSVDGKVLTVEFSVSNPLPTSSTEVTLKNITDMFNNKAADIKLNVYAAADTVRPEFVSASAENQTGIVVEFTKDVVVDNANYTIKDKDNNTVSFTAAYLQVDGKNVTNKVKLSGTFAAGTYTLTIANVIDVNPLQNRILAVAVTVNVPDKTAPTFTVVEDSGNNKLYVVFSEKVDSSLATTKANYNYIKGTIQPLNADTTVKLLSDGKTVELAFPTTGDNAVSIGDITVLQVSGVKDLAGNVVTTQAVDLSGISALTDAPAISEVAVTGKNTIEVRLDAAKAGIVDSSKTVSDFVIKNADGAIIQPINITYNADDKVITLTVNENLSADAKYNGKAITLATIATTNAYDVYGRKLTANTTGLTAVDEFAPVATAGAVTATTFTVNFSEALDVTGVGAEGQFIVLVDGAARAFTVTYDSTNHALEFTVTGGIAADKTVNVKYFASPTASENLADVDDNKVANFDLSKKR